MKACWIAPAAKAILRMQENALRQGAEAVFNLKFETARIGQNAGQRVRGRLKCWLTVRR